MEQLEKNKKQSNVFCKQSKVLILLNLIIFILLAILDTFLILINKPEAGSVFINLMRYVVVITLVLFAQLISHVYAKNSISKTEFIKEQNENKHDEIIHDYKQLIYHDELTKIMNKEGLRKVLDNLITENKPFTFLNIDLDDFKLINDLKGVLWSDKALILIAQMLEGFGRNYIPSRILDDSFGLVIIEQQSEEAILAISKLILSNIKKILEKEDSSYVFGASIGIALNKENEDNATDIIKRSELALSVAKKDGKSRIIFYKEAYLQEKVLEILLLSAIKPSLKNNDFYVEYQPVIDINNKTTLGVETLLRWNHPDLGFIAPDKFIKLAEKTDDIHRLTEFVIRTSFEQVSKWEKEGTSLYILINLSPKDLNDSNLPSILLKYAQMYNINPKKVVLEITEATKLDQISKAKEIMNEIKKNDFKIAIDDFGTGYSTLTYIKDFPIDIVKLDRSFVANIDKEVEDRFFLKFVLDISKSLRKHVIIEGVETLAQENILKDYGVTYAQGYFYSKAKKAHELTEVFHDYKLRSEELDNN